MDSIRKLFLRVPKKHRVQLMAVIECLLNPECLSTLHPEKLTDSHAYRLRSGRYRIIFHKDKKGDIVIDDIRLRNEGTYRGT